MESRAAKTRARGYDLLIVTDATASMGSYLSALNQALPEIIRISRLTACFDSIGVIAYRDYCGGELLQWSGWFGKNGTTGQDGLLAFCSRLRASSGGDWPEAAKTGLSKAYDVLRQETVVVLYSDAPPHMPCTGGSNRRKEIDALSGTKFGDWASASAAMAERCQVFALIHSPLVDTVTPYMYLCHRTGGTCLELSSPNSAAISELTVSLLLDWMGVAKAGAPVASRTVAKVKSYRDTAASIKDERDPECRKYWVLEDRKDEISKTKENLSETPVTLDGLRDAIRPREEPVQDFSQRYKTDPGYRSLVVGTLADIIDKNVEAMSVNPVFGSLWRTVCNDRANEAREGLTSSFGLRVDQIVDPDAKQRMKSWLEQSYDYKGEILEMLGAVGEDEKYPCVFLDPTLDFGGEENIRNFTREELLEIGRSCDYRVLRRLGKVLTRFTYVDSAGELPAHVKSLDDAECPKIPLALASESHRRKFWKILLHLVLEGTMITPRPAALLAALSLKMGVAPLREIAESEMLGYKEKWNTLEIPETWNSNCLSLILDADADYRARTGGGSGLVSDGDRGLFETLVDYKMLEHNLETTLFARASWHPDKAGSAIGPIVVCKRCENPRSVTMMAEAGVCGMCVDTSCPCTACMKMDNPGAASANVSDSEGVWVECCDVQCRAQYVVYNPSRLRVRAKCFYCRHGSTKAMEDRQPAPVVECSKCLSRIIWPVEYRPLDLDTKAWACPACRANKITIVDYETTARKLAVENGDGWLLANEDNKISRPFTGASLFKTISAAGTDDFAAKVRVFPATASPGLTIRGKCVMNSGDVVSSLASWVKRRRAEAGTCSLCFSDVAKKQLWGACGRSGCSQAVCDSCREGWFGINKPGSVINTAALSCPFCRRLPAAKVVRRFGIHALPGLRDAVARSGDFIFAWCAGCGHAVEYMERVCAQGAPPHVDGWRCDGCRGASEHRSAAPGINPCPGCKTPTEKLSGCDHITCTVAGCGAHWCWSCGFIAQDASQVYDHMQKVHDGLYGEEEYDTESDEGEEY